MLRPHRCEPKATQSSRDPNTTDQQPAAVAVSPAAVNLRQDEGEGLTGWRREEALIVTQVQDGVGLEDGVEQ